MTNQFMQDGITYMVNKAYVRGIKHSFTITMGMVLIASFIGFMAGRTYEYVQTIESGAKVVEQFKITTAN